MASVVVGIVVISVESTVALATNVGIVDVILKPYLLGSSIGCCRRVGIAVEKAKSIFSPQIERGLILTVMYICSANSELILASLGTGLSADAIISFMLRY